jgi:hypothetical protein
MAMTQTRPLEKEIWLNFAVPVVSLILIFHKTGK